MTWGGEVTLNSRQSILIDQTLLDRVSSVLWTPYGHLKRPSTDHTTVGRRTFEQVRQLALSSGDKKNADGFTRSAFS